MKLAKQTNDKTLGELATARVALSRAEIFLQATLNDTDHLDVKALHLTVGDIAAFTILVTFQKDWLWTVPEVILGLAAFCFYLVFKPRRWELGPDPDVKHSKHGIANIWETMEEVLWAADENETKLERKSQYFRWGYRIFALGLMFSFALALFDK